MKMHKFVSVCLLCLLLLALAGNFLPCAQGDPDFVTDTDDYIAIENSYFIANISKSYHGSVKYFYIKPETSVNIVAPESEGFHFLPGEESIWSWNSSTRTSCDWQKANGKSSQTTQVVYQTSSVVTVESLTQFKKDSSHFWFKIARYWTFYSDKPYYLFFMKRTYQEDCAHIGNYESCYLLDPSWAEKAYFLNETAQVDEGDSNTPTKLFRLKNLLRYNKYPWVMAYNSTYNLGHFTILTSASHDIGLTGLTKVAGRYSEYQVAFQKPAVINGDEFWYSAVNGVAENTTYVNNLMASVFSSTVEQANTDRKVVSSANWTDAGNWGVGIIPCTQYLGMNWRPYSGVILQGSYTDPPDRPISSTITVGEPRMYWYPRYTNSTNTYDTWGVSTCPEQTWENDGEYTKVTWQYDYNSKLRFKWTLQMWNDSDSYYVSWYWKALQTINLTELFTHLYVINAPTTSVTVASLNNSVVKVNATDAYLSDMYDEGFIVQNFTNTQTNIHSTSHWFCDWYAQKNTGDVEYPADTEWNMTLMYQHFRRYNNTNPTYFNLTNVCLPSQHHSELDDYDKQAWAKFPDLTSEEFVYRVNSHIGDVSFAHDRLTLHIFGESGTTSTTKVYVGDKGEPTRVLVDTIEQPINYNSSTKILTITATHTSNPTEIVVDWNLYPPKASFFYSPLNPYVNDTVTFNALDSRPNGGHIDSYQWDFGDGFLDQGVIVTHIYDTAGTYKVTLNVTDSEGLWNSTTTTMTVRMLPPPSIWKVEHSPELPKYNETVTITANITSQKSGIDVVILNYYNGSEWANITMTIENELYVAAIPMLPYGTAVQYKVYASNDVGNWAETNTFSYTVTDTIPPDVAPAQWSPKKPSAGEDVFVSTQVSEPAFASGVKNVTLLWSVNGKEILSSTMIMEDAIWKATIPGQGGDKHVYFSIESYDHAGNCATSQWYGYTVKVAEADSGLLVLVAILATVTVLIGIIIGIAIRKKAKDKTYTKASHFHFN